MIVVLAWLACIIVAGLIARRRGRSAAIWAALCLLLTPIVIPVLLVLPVLKKCPRCSERAKADAKICRHCSYEFS
jgi:hypothetical protein